MEKQLSMKYFRISVTSMLVRFYLMMLIVIIGFATQMYWVLLLALPIFLSGMMGLRLDKKEDGDR